jgi:hypothetical protein
MLSYYEEGRWTEPRTGSPELDTLSCDVSPKTRAKSLAHAIALKLKEIGQQIMIFRRPDYRGEIVEYELHRLTEKNEGTGYEAVLEVSSNRKPQTTRVDVTLYTDNPQDIDCIMPVIQRVPEGLLGRIVSLEEFLSLNPETKRRAVVRIETALRNAFYSFFSTRSI